MAGMRASDQDRDKAVEVIEDAYAKGQLNGDERELRTQRALQAATIDELNRLTSDLRPAPATHYPQPSVITENRRRPINTRALGIVAAVLIAIFALGALMYAGSTGGSSEGSASSPEVVNAPAEVKGELLTEKGLTGLIAAVDRKFGTTTVSDAVVYPDYAVFTVPVAGNPRHTERWYFRGKFDAKAQSTGNREADDTLIDLGKADVSTLIGWVGKAGSELNVKDVTTRYLVFDERDDKPAMSVYVSNKFSDSGYASLNLDGSELYIYKYK